MDPVSLLMLVKLANTGIMLWNTVGPYIQGMLERGETETTMDQVELAATNAGHDVEALRAAIAAMS